MRLLCISIFLIFGLYISAIAEGIPRVDYFFIYNGGVFIHQTGKPIENFEHFALPESKTYSQNIQLADITPEGDMICVLRGINENDDKIDLVRITRDMKITPLFTIAKREDLPDGAKIDRTFGDVDYDPSTGKAVFSIIERRSKGLGLSAQNAEYLSKVYRVFFKGGSCDLIADYNGQIEDISSGGGLVAILKKIPGESIQMNQLQILFPSEKDWTPLTSDKAENLISADLSPDGKSILLSEIKSSVLGTFLLKKYSLSDKKLIELEIVLELDSDNKGSGYQYTIDGKNITWTQKRTNPWGENQLTFLMTPDKAIYPLVRDDFAGKFVPIPAPKTKGRNIEKVWATPRLLDKSTEFPGALSVTGVKGGAQPVFFEENPDHTGRIFYGDSKTIDQIEIGTFPNGTKGIYYADERWFACPELELGEKLLSFENVSYGKISEKATGAPPINYEVHLSWSVGGKMVGLRVPEKEIFIGGDDLYLHVVLKYPFIGTYPVSEFVTPFYLLALNNWTLDRPTYFGAYKTESHYFVKSSRDQKGNLYLLDSLNSRILRYDTNHRRRELGYLPDGFIPLAYPTDMFINANEIWINDPINNRVVVFTLDGIPVEEINVDIKAGTLDSTRFATVHDKDFSLINLTGKKVWEIHS